ncbi:MAG: DUF1444 family protein [Caldilineaceae bacterium]
MIILSALNRMGRGGSMLSPEEFTEHFCKTLAEREPDIVAVVDKPLALSLSNADGGNHRAFLGNVYAEYTMAPQKMTEIVDRYLSAMRQTFKAKGKALDTSRIVPVVKDWRFIEDTRAALKVAGTPDDEIPQVFERYNDTLVVLYAEDTPETISYPSIDMLAEVGLGLANLRPRAVANLKAMLPPPKITPMDGFYHVSAGGFYEASLLLMDSFWRTNKMAVEGQYVVAIPIRGVLLVTGHKDRLAVELLRHVALKFGSEGAYPLTTQLFIYKGGRFVELD